MATQEAIQKAVEALRPEAKLVVAELMNDPYKTTKDNYGKAMAYLTALGKYGPLLLAAMVKEGYPKITADQLKQLMGW